jgi:KEOPS complex subunit Cgi121
MHEEETFGEIKPAICTIANTSEFLKTIQEVSREFQVHLICFDADKIAGMRHAGIAVKHAMRSFLEGRQISNSLEMESLLYAAGSRQCSTATSFGIHPGENHLYICCIPTNEQVWRMLESSTEIQDKDPWAVITQEKHALLMTLFGITPEECAIVTAAEFPDLVLERVALLDVYH